MITRQRGRGHQSVPAIKALQVVAATTLLFSAQLTLLRPASADLLGWAAGDTINNAMQQSQDLVRQATDNIRSLENQVNEHAKERLDQLQDIANQTEAKLVDLEQKTFADVNQLTAEIQLILNSQQDRLSTLEQKVMDDVSEKIQEVQCATDVILNEQWKDSMGKVGALLGLNQIVLNAPVLYDGEHETCHFFWSCKVHHDFTIQEPFSGTYDDIKKYLEGRLDNMRADTPVQSVVDTYFIVGEFAKRASCHGGVDKAKYLGEFVKYNALAEKWKRVLKFEE